jgi:hypothetical protein
MTSTRPAGRQPLPRVWHIVAERHRGTRFHERARKAAKIGYAGRRGPEWSGEENGMAAVVVVSFAAIFLAAILWATSRRAGEPGGGH